MNVGISIPPTTESSEHLLEWVRRVDAGPFSILSILDRVVYPNLEPLVALSSAAAVSSRVRLMTEVLISPIRNSAVLAKQCATLDVLSNGRLTLGLGTGGRENDYVAAGIPYQRRGDRLEEQMNHMKSIWAGRASGPDAAGPVGPLPIQEGGPEVVLGGFVPRAFRRAARCADGFITATNDVEQVDGMFRSIEQSWLEAGRVEKPRLIAQMDIALETQNVGQGRKNVLDYYAITPPFDEIKSATLLTTERQLSEIMRALEQIGTDEVVFFTWSTETDQIDRIAQLVG